MDLTALKKTQEELCRKVVLEPLKKTVRFVLGVDSSYAFKEDTLYSVAVLYDVVEGKIIEESFCKKKAEFPYIPGFLSFREIDSTLQAIKGIKGRIDVIMADGQGIAHPRGLGFASHIGVVLDMSSVGCAKKRLVGEFEEPGAHKGTYSYLYFKGKAVGAVLRAKNNVNPVFVSPGHKIDLQSSISLVMETVKGYRLPEPVRLAHIFSNRVKMETPPHD